MGARAVYNIAPVSDADGVATSQALGGAGNVTLDGAEVVNGVAIFANAHTIEIISTGNDSGITFTITGTDSRDIGITDVVTGANIGTASSAVPFKTITQIASDGAAAGTIEVGTSGLAFSDWFTLTEGNGPLQLGIFIELSTGAVLTYEEQHTADDIQDLDESVFFTFPHSDLTAKTASDDGNIYFPPVASRIAVTAFTSGTAKATYIRYDN